MLFRLIVILPRHTHKRSNALYGNWSDREKAKEKCSPSHIGEHVGTDLRFRSLSTSHNSQAKCPCSVFATTTITMTSCCSTGSLGRILTLQINRNLTSQRICLLQFNIYRDRDYLPRIGGRQNSPTNPHSGTSGGGSLKIPQVSGEYTVNI